MKKQTQKQILEYLDTMFFCVPDLLPIEEEIYLLSFDIPVTFFLDWLEKMDRKRTCQVLAQGYEKKKEE